MKVQLTKKMPFIILTIVLCTYAFRKYSSKTSLDTKDKLCTNYEIKRSNKSYLKQRSSPQFILTDYLTLKGSYKYTPKDLRHILPLALAAVLTEGDILDLSIDIHTTQVLRNIAKDQNRFLLSIENENAWLKKFIDWNNTDNHLLLQADSDCAMGISNDKQWSVASISHLNQFRHDKILKIYNNTQILFVYNSDFKNIFLNSEIYESLFRFNCKSTLNFDDGTHSAVFIYTNFFQKFMVMDAALQKINVQKERYFCSSSSK
jgi:hypothetical protein